MDGVGVLGTAMTSGGGQDALHQNMGNQLERGNTILIKVGKEFGGQWPPCWLQNTASFAAFGATVM